MNEKTFELGERRRVTLEVWLSNGQSFQPLDVSWSLRYLQQEEASGSCDVVQDGGKWQLTAEVEPQKRARYRLQFSFGMGTEIVKRSVFINVV